MVAIASPRPGVAGDSDGAAVGCNAVPDDAGPGCVVHRRAPFMVSHRKRDGQPLRTHAASSSARQSNERLPIRIGMGSRPERFQLPTVFFGTPNALAAA